MKTNSAGNCYLCGANLTKTAMRNHLFKVHAEDKDGKECRLLRIEGFPDKNYWLYIDIPADETLSELDAFLREIWLECCGHMSEFTEYKRGQRLYGPRPGPISSKKKLKTFAAGEMLLHAYDFGSATESIITVIGNTLRKPQKDIVRLLARNAPPVFKCAGCGETAEYIDTESRYESDNPFYCEECAKEYDFEMILPVTNSPRMGECGYAGELDTFEFNPESIQVK